MQIQKYCGAFGAEGRPTDREIQDDYTKPGVAMFLGHQGAGLGDGYEASIVRTRLYPKTM